MELLGLWLGTSIASIIIEVENELRIFKDTADAGYKIDVKRISELGSQFGTNKVALISLIIPVINVIQVFQRVLKYNNIRPMLLDQLYIIGALEEMSEIEKSEYLKNPTGLNALIMPFKSEMRLSNASIVKIDDGSESKIYYEIDKNGNITILKVSGFVSRLTEEEQKLIINEFLKLEDSFEIEKTILKSIDEEHENSETLSDILSDSEEKADETITSSISKQAIIEQRQSLKNLRKQILGAQEESQIDKKEEEGPTLTKKRK